MLEGILAGLMPNLSLSKTWPGRSLLGSNLVDPKLTTRLIHLLSFASLLRGLVVGMGWDILWLSF